MSIDWIIFEWVWVKQIWLCHIYLDIVEDEVLGRWVYYDLIVLSFNAELWKKMSDEGACCRWKTRTSIIELLDRWWWAAECFKDELLRGSGDNWVWVDNRWLMMSGWRKESVDDGWCANEPINECVCNELLKNESDIDELLNVVMTSFLIIDGWMADDEEWAAEWEWLRMMMMISY